jgi:hypothetical protein
LLNILRRITTTGRPLPSNCAGIVQEFFDHCANLLEGKPLGAIFCFDETGHGLNAAGKTLLLSLIFCVGFILKLTV